MTHSNPSTIVGDGLNASKSNSGWGAARKTERILELVMFQSRWLLAPLYVGLVAALVMIGWRFA